MQKCQYCQKVLESETIVMVKCPAYFEQFSDGVHRIQPEDVAEIWCMQCEDEDELD